RCAGIILQVDAGDEVVVGRQPLQRRVVLQHTGGAAGGDVEALFDTGIDAALADDYFAIERARRKRRQAQLLTGRREDHRGRRVNAVGDRSAGQFQRVAVVGGQRDGADEVAVRRAGANGHRPGAMMAGRVGSRPTVSGGRRDKDAIVVSYGEGQLDNVGVGAAAAADGEVDHIDAVENGLLDRGDRVALVTAFVAADAVGNDVSARRDAGDDAPVHTKQAGGDPTVAGGGRRGVRAVTVVIAGRVELSGQQTLDCLVSIEEGVSADQLVITGKRLIVRIVSGVAEVAGVARTTRAEAVGAGYDGRRRIRIAEWIGIRERGVLGPDPRVEDTDNNPLAGTLLPAQHIPDCGRADELLADLGVRL